MDVVGEYRILTLAGKTYVLRKVERPRFTTDLGVAVQIDPPNYRGTGCALCGILKPGQTLEDFINKRYGIT